jgi:hypothetical protein
MRRESLVAVFMIAALTACRDAAPGGGQAPAPANAAPSAAGLGDSYPGPNVASDIVSGCVEGAPVVKVLIRLTLVDKMCHAELTPGSVCVMPGAIIRWKIDNDCQRLEGKDGTPALEITAPIFKVHLDGRRERPKSETSTDAKKKLDSCRLNAAMIDKGSKIQLFCEVDQNAPYGFYKYGLKGDQIETLDPDVEVRGGR